MKCHDDDDEKHSKKNNETLSLMLCILRSTLFLGCGSSSSNCRVGWMDASLQRLQQEPRKLHAYLHKKTLIGVCNLFNSIA